MGTDGSHQPKEHQSFGHPHKTRCETPDNEWNTSIEPNPNDVRHTPDDNRRWVLLRQSQGTLHDHQHMNRMLVIVNRKVIDTL